MSLQWWWLLDGCCWSSVGDGVGSPVGGIGPLWFGCGFGILHGGGFDEHRRLVTKTTLIMRRTRGDFGLHGPGCEGAVHDNDDVFHLEVFVFGGRCDGCRRPCPWLSPFLFKVKVVALVFSYVRSVVLVVVGV
jgi:hypothetical protein